MGAVDGAFYYVNGGKWYNTENTMNINWTPDDSLQENDRVELSLTLAPALYVKEEGRVDWEALGKGASLSMPVTIDNTAPTLDGVSVDPIQKTMTVKAHDNQYIAAVVLFNAGGATVLDFDGTRDGVQAGDTCTYELDLQKANGNKFLVQVIDYANNVTTYVLKMQLGEEQPVPEMFAFDGKKGCWIGFNRGDTRESAQEIAVGNHTFFGATAADGVIVAIDGNADLYILNPEDLTEETFVTNLGMQLTDLAYNPKDQELYGVNNSNQLVRIDKLCGSAESLGAIGGDIGIVVNTLACDGEGNFYTVSYGNGFANQPGMVFTFTLDNISSPKRVTNNGYFNNYIQALEVNPNNGLLYWASYYDTSTETQEKYKGVLFEIDPKTGEVTNLGDFQTELTSLCIPEKHTGGHWYDPTDEIASMELSAEQLRLLQGAKQQLSATILPWTVRDRTVTWISSDEAVATVDPDGVVTAVGDGQCTITATSNLNAAVTANCQVEVESVHSSVEGVLEDMDGNVRLFSWNLENDRFWTPGVVTNVPSPIGAAVYDAENDKMYIRDNDWVKMHEVDAATGNIVKSSGSSWYSVDDLTALQLFGTVETPQVVGVAGADVYKPCAPISNSFGSTWRLPTRTYTGGSNLVAITSMGQAVNEEGVNCDLLYAMDNAGYLWAIWYDGEEISYNYMNTELSQMELVFPQKGGLHCCSMVADEDGVLYFSYYNGAGNDLYRLRYDPAEDIYRVHLLGNFGEGNYPACLTLAKRNDAAQGEGGFSVPVAPAMRAEAVTRTEEDVAREALLDSKDALAQDVRPVAAEVAEPQEAPVGGLDAVQAGMVQEAREVLRLPAELLHVGHETQCNGKTVTLTLTADEETTNGLITLEYDATKLTLTEASGKALLNSFHEEAGCLTFGYANQEAIPAGSVLATVTFTAEADTEAEFEVTTLENNEDYPGKVEHITVTVPEHDYIVSVVPATCEAGGYTLYTCRNCGESYKDHLTDALGHDWSAWTETREPTCTEAGEETRTCANCNETETRSVAAKGHTLKDTVVAATCTTEGYTLHECTVCGYSYRDTVTPALGHQWGQWTVEQEADCFHDGKETRTCATCSETESRIVPANDGNCPSKDFQDLDCTCWYHEGVDFALDQGFMVGMGDGRFLPNGELTRGQLMTILYRMAGEPEAAETTPFADVKMDQYYGQAIAWAAENGIAKGITDTRFAPNTAVTREQLVTFLFRYAQFSHEDVKGVCDLTEFADHKAVSDFAREPMAWAVDTGILTGMDGLLNPKGDATRAQIATMLLRYFVAF
ncbi:MAG: S-layer homology domain-containing protein [Oscillospiraceae bacterium]